MNCGCLICLFFFLNLGSGLGLLVGLGWDGWSCLVLKPNRNPDTNFNLNLLLFKIFLLCGFGFRYRAYLTMCWLLIL